jgi:hypothetical protein
MHDLELRFEFLYVSSLAVKYYLSSLGRWAKPGAYSPISVLGHGLEDTGAYSLLESYSFDFSDGIYVPGQETPADSLSPRRLAVTHNRDISNVHRGIVFCAKDDKSTESVSMSAKASFDLADPKVESTDDSQLPYRYRRKKAYFGPALIWLTLEGSGKEGVGLNTFGCCNGLALDKFVVLRQRIRSQEGK